MKNIKSKKQLGIKLILPAFLLLIFGILFPSLWGVYLSFTDMRLGRDASIVGLDNYLYLLTENNFKHSLKVNIIFVVTVVVLQMIFGLLLALFLNQKFHFHKLWFSLILTPIAMTPSVIASAWKYILDFNLGILNYLIQQIGLSRVMWLSDSNIALMTVMGISVWFAIPFVFIMLYPARLSINETLYEAAKIDGAKNIQLFQYITFPLLKPALLVVLIFRTIFSLRTFGIIWNLTEGGPTRATETMAIYLYKEGFRNWRFGTAATVGTIMLIITILLSASLIKNLYQTVFKVNE